MPTLRVEWAYSDYDKPEAWSIMLRDDGTLLVMCNGKEMVVPSSEVMRMLDAFRAMFGL